MFVRVSDTAIVLFLVFVFYGVRSGIAAQPELFDELVTLFIVGELLEGCKLFTGDDPFHVIVEPLLVSLADFLLEVLRVLLLLFRRDLTLQWINFLGCGGLPVFL